MDIILCFIPIVLLALIIIKVLWSQAMISTNDFKVISYKPHDILVIEQSVWSGKRIIEYNWHGPTALWISKTGETTAYYVYANLAKEIKAFKRVNRSK